MRSTKPSSLRRGCAVATAFFFLLQAVLPIASAQSTNPAKTPINHVIVIIGENRTFDHVFATYKPQPGSGVWNLRSEGIVNEYGYPGPNFSKAAQFTAVDSAPSPFLLSPGSKQPYTVLPAPMTAGSPTAPSDSFPGPFATLAAAAAGEPALLPQSLPYLLTGASGLPNHVVDTRIFNVNQLPNGPFQLTRNFTFDSYTGSPVHRFYQMWQQLDCNVSNASSHNPSGCLADLFPWVETTIGAGTNGKPQPTPFTNQTTGEGATSMAFYNIAFGDVPFFKRLADQGALSDNMHQAVMGGTGANHVMLGTGDAVFFSDGKGNAMTPPTNQIEDPDPQTGTNNWYTQDGYGGGTYSNCSDATQPGVSGVVSYLSSLPYTPKPNCDPGHYYLLNNYAPGYYGDGTVNTGANNPFTVPPSSVRNIGDALLEKNISWKYYGEGWNAYLQDPTFSNPLNTYCDICNPFLYSTSIMTNESARQNSLADIEDLYNDIQDGTLPAVSFVKPGFLLDGHPASSKLDLFEGFVLKIYSQIIHTPLWGSTAILITFDEGGGYYDSGHVQPLDFFGDGTRIPLIAVSPWAKHGQIIHQYYDHVSILKFIERNWGLSPLTSRSRDNLPNPIVNPNNPYIPLNSPAIGDLMDMFYFKAPN